MMMTVLMRMFPVEKRGTAMGLFGLVIAFAPAIGPTAAGLVIDHMDWRDLFFIIAALAVIVTLIAPAVLGHEEPSHPDATLDKPSVILSTLGFGSLLYGFSAIGSSSISVQALVSCAMGVAVLVFFFRRQLKMDEPMLQVRVLKTPTFLVGTIIGMLVQASLLAAGVLMPIYLQSIRGFSATVSGLVLLPGAILTGVMGPVAGRLFDKHGPRVLSLVGMTLLVISTFMFAFLGDSTDLGFIICLYTVRMFAITLVNMPITTWAMNSLDNRLINHGTSVNNTFRQVAGSLGTAILVSAYTLVSQGLASSTDAAHASITGINVAFAIGATLCLIGLVLTVIFVKPAKSDEGEEETDSQSLNRSVLESVMKRDVFTVRESATVLEAMQLLVDKKISAAPVVDDAGKPIGFISDGDIMRHLSKRSELYTDPVLYIMHAHHDDTGFDAKVERVMSMSVSDIAHKGIVGIDIHDDLPTVCRILGDNHLKKAPVLAHGKLVGVVNRSDLTQYSMQEYLRHTEHA